FFRCCSMIVGKAIHCSSLGTCFFADFPFVDIALAIYDPEVFPLSLCFFFLHCSTRP
ncbi:hypothetical protein A2U01_0068165, partial [Trifolium medium]|nr:hypothetical protein [Trifolium medium]